MSTFALRAASTLSAGLLAFAITAAPGCGSDSDGGGAGPAASGGTSGTTGGFGGTSGSSGTGGDGGASSGSAGSAGSSGSSGSSSGDDDTCAATAKRAETLPIDIGLVVDTSFSMDFEDKWVNLRAALKAFVNNPAYAELGLGVQFFPARKQCNVTEYGTPAVAIGLLPDVAGPVSSALDAQQMDLGTPITQVLLGMTQYMRGHATAKPNRKSILLLATDGLPDDSCITSTGGNTPNTLPNAVVAARDAFSGTPSIPTFVIGVGTELAALDQIAAAGGSGTAILVDPAKNAQEAFLAALETIRKKAVPCDYDIPPLGGAQLDAQKVNVSYSTSGTSSETLGFVGSVADCAKAPDKGWYFDNPTKATKISLCPATCERVKANENGQISVVFGCERIDVK